MQYAQPFDQPNLPNAPYVDGNPSMGTPGSIPRAAAIEYPQREIVNTITQGNLTPDNGDLYQLTRVIRGGQLDFASDTGTANALVATLGLAHNAMRAGLPFKVLKGNAANSSAAPTLTVTGPGGSNAISGVITKCDGTPVAAGDLPANAMLILISDGTNWRLLALVTRSDMLALVASITRVNAPAGAITIYVRTDGSDNNFGGQQNSAGSAFATIGAAYSYLTKSFNPGFTATIQLGIPGTYAGFVAANNGVTGSISVVGDTSANQANQTSYIITPIVYTTGYVCVLSTIQTLTLLGLTLDASNLSNAQVCNVARAGGGGTLALGNVTLRASTNNANISLMEEDVGSTINLVGNINVVAGTIGQVISSYGNFAVTLPAGITLAMSNVTFANAFAQVVGGNCNLNLMSFSGTGNKGVQYTVDGEGTLVPPAPGGAAGIATIPGTSAGVAPFGRGIVLGDLGVPWTQTSPGITSTGGAFTTASSVCRYQRYGKWVTVLVQVNVTTVGSQASGQIITQLPFVPASNLGFAGREIAQTGKAITGSLSNANGQIQFSLFDGSSAIVAGGQYVMMFTYEAQS